MAEAIMTLAASPPTVESAPQQRDRVEEAFDHAEHRSQVQGAHVRAVAVAIIGGWLVVENTTWAVLYYERHPAWYSAFSAMHRSCSALAAIGVGGTATC